MSEPTPEAGATTEPAELLFSVDESQESGAAAHDGDAAPVDDLAVTPSDVEAAAAVIGAEDATDDEGAEGPTATDEAGDAAPETGQNATGSDDEAAEAGATVSARAERASSVRAWRCMVVHSPYESGRGGTSTHAPRAVLRKGRTTWRPASPGCGGGLRVSWTRERGARVGAKARPRCHP